MNHLELTALQSALSNEARVLYCLYLRPKAIQQDNSPPSTVEINNKDILSLLNTQNNTLSLGREISALFKELFLAGLIDIEGNYSFQRSLNKHRVRLSLLSEAAKVSLSEETLHQQHQAMSLEWRPAETWFEQVCHLVGVIEKHFDADELGEFIAYWLGRPEVQQTPYQWTHKFVLHLKQRRVRKPTKQEQSKAGHQWITPKAGIDFDDNVRKLIDKYSGQA